MSRPVIVAAALVLVGGCASAQPRPADERARIEAATQHYAAVLRGAPVDSVVAVYADDGELVIPGVATLHGRKAIRDFLAPLAATVTVASVEMQVDSVAVTGNSAVEHGRYRQVAGPTGGPAQEFRGAFDATWTRGADAEWRLVRLVMQPTARTP
jgi:uncharacterized protein (TIGR02246 family)